jgi:hypothetical protein
MMAAIPGRAPCGVQCCSRGAKRLVNSIFYVYSILCGKMIDLSFALEKLVVYFHLYCRSFGIHKEKVTVTIEVLMESAK